jgi:hypothetical protein
VVSAAVEDPEATRGVSDSLVNIDEMTDDQVDRLEAQLRARAQREAESDR